MKKYFLLNIGVKLGLAAILFLSGTRMATAQQICITNQEREWNTSGIYWQLWNWNMTGTSCMTRNAGMTFSTVYNGIDNHLARRGLYYGDGHGQSWDDRGGFYAEYTVDWQPEWVDNGNSNFNIYGWTNNPIAEFYIVENWYQWNHAQETGAQSFGTVIINGHEYEMVKVTRTNAPNPFGGNVTFPQYVSVRKDRGSAVQSNDPSGVVSGKINIGQHFAAWQNTGQMPMTGDLYEVALNVEGWKSSGSANVTQLNITTMSGPQSIALTQNSYSLNVGQDIILDWSYVPSTYGSTDVLVVSNNNNVALWYYKGKWLMTGMNPGAATIKIFSPDGTKSDTATVTVSAGTAPFRMVETRALGTKGDEKIYLLRDGQPVNQGHTLTTNFQTYTDVVYGEGEISVEFANDDGVANGRDVRVDYISVDGVKRETEDMAENSAAYANGVCGGGAFTEWLHCSGDVNYGPLAQDHVIKVRARGTNGGEHIVLMINGQAVNSGWTLGTTFKEYTAIVSGDGDINVKYDNDGGLKDVVIDWLKVDSQTPRQAENMQYNTGAFANGRCGGGQFTQWMHCNGVIGFGKISDNFN